MRYLTTGSFLRPTQTCWTVRYPGQTTRTHTRSTSLPGNTQYFKDANQAQTNPFNEHGLLGCNEHTTAIGEV
jgi:hypothetical protein